LPVGCGKHKEERVSVPPPPPIAPPSPPTPSNPPSKTTPSEGATTSETITLPADAKPIFTETGLASWYGAPYHNHAGSNGKIYDMNAMTAAHRTLPLGSIVRVTNLKTGRSALVRITDRGPFVDGRIVDLSLAAAKAVDVWRPGVAEVRLEVMQTPAPLDSGGRWAVQIGGFEEQKSAQALQDRLSRRYHTAKVIKFISPVGVWWVRVRVLDDTRRRAEEVAHDTTTNEGTVFLVRLD
jgi:rare lipoprotein A